MNSSFYTCIGKRWFDATIATLGLIVVSPALALAAIAVRLSSPGSVFFRQTRTGRFGQPFEIVKLRTMKVTPGASSFPLPAAEDSRITKVGHWLRRSKFDELPQLLNVVRGEMTLVGPRPELPCYAALYSIEQAEILNVKPGLTSPASIAFSGEEELLSAQQDRRSYYLETILPAKLSLDLAYARDIRLASDLRILLRTCARLFSRHAIPVLGRKGLSESHEEMV